MDEGDENMADDKDVLRGVVGRSFWYCRRRSIFEDGKEVTKKCEEVKICWWTLLEIPQPHCMECLQKQLQLLFASFSTNHLK